ncbi:MAG: CRISPR-associated endonuclease Cas2 [Burkholderiales bacterium]|nr:CRISPR-associated endonuclease Cas2 [Burkholderiales bacterium]MDE1926906.1 CRISPR-associated endonuclease Cas2 [Burkholderiales bacterium]MDE2157525.1 CRISPR-associated endonuclease Cas2 [Burkholderiales bacterium]MDE2501731.1 CRISPR-associated endonuclease Cas2 [Burkholderiales bacterium]
MADEHLYLVTYDIADDRRWRAVFKMMHGYGEWLQLSVFQCRLTRARQVEMVARLESTIARDADHVMVVDLGPAENVQPRVVSLGKRGFAAVERAPVIV